MIDQEKIYNQWLSENPEERRKALEQLKDSFSSLPDKQQAWNDLHKLTNDKDSGVRSNAASVLGSVFSDVPDKQKAWNDLIRLTTDKDSLVKYSAASALGSVFFYVPDKQQAWSDLVKLTTDKDIVVRCYATSALGSVFSDMPDKQQAWNDLHKLTYDKNSSVRYRTASVLGSVFSYVPDKQQAWNDLIRLTTDKDSYVRSNASPVLGSLFSDVPDKQKAWNDLIRLTTDKDSGVRFCSSSALGSIFSGVPDKQQAWNDLIRLTTDEDRNVRWSAAEALGSVFPNIPDKQQAWNDLIKLASDKDNDVRYDAALALGSAFSQVPDKEQAWNDLHKLIDDKDDDVRLEVASALGSAFPHVPDKGQAWNDLHKLINDEESYVRFNAASALGSAFPHVPNKGQAWNDLHKLTNDKDDDVRYDTASALGSAFPHVPDKQQAWNDLIRLTNDKDRSVRTSANHSLGKVSIFKASQAEKDEDYKKELEKAITFFEKAAQESLYEWSNPAKFCLPFYRSFYTIIFQKQEEAKEEVDKYLAEAKDAVRGSKSKELLFGAVENLANALKEVQNLGNMDLEAKKGELNFYRKYCDHAAELMRKSEETAPFATIAMRKGLPILNRNLREILEIQKKTELISEQTKGTQFEELGNELNQHSLFLLQVRDPVGFKKQVNIMQNTMRAICSKFPEDQKGEACELLRIMYAEPAIEDKIPLMVNILSKFSYQLDMTTHLNKIEAKLDLIQEDLKVSLKKLDTLSQKVGGKEGELIQTFSKKVLELTKKGDKEALQSFLEEVLKNENVLIEEIENSSAPLEEKEESKSSVSKIRSVLDTIKSLGKDVTKEIVVSYAAEEIVKLVFQLVSMATLGVPIPPQILNLLKNVIKEYNK